MSLFDDDLVTRSLLTEEQVKNAIERVFLGLLVLNHTGATIIHLQENDAFPLMNWVKKKGNITVKVNQIVTTGELRPDDTQLINVPVFIKHYNRPVVVLDCSKLCKGDALGFMNTISKMPTNPKPVVIISNITDIPAEDDIHDNPMYIENILLHSWKNEGISFTELGGFSLKSSDFTVLFPIIESKISNIRTDYLRNDGYANISYVKDLDEFVKSFPDEQHWYKEKGFIEYEIPIPWKK